MRLSLLLALVLAGLGWSAQNRSPAVLAATPTLSVKLFVGCNAVLYVPAARPDVTTPPSCSAAPLPAACIKACPMRLGVSLRCADVFFVGWVCNGSITGFLGTNQNFSASLHTYPGTANSLLDISAPGHYLKQAALLDFTTALPTNLPAGHLHIAPGKNATFSATDLYFSCTQSSTVCNLKVSLPG